jgi:hypothetical protein
VHPGGYAAELMSECIVRLEKTACPEFVEVASETLKVQITATGPYRYRLEGMVYALLHIKTIDSSIKNPALGHEFGPNGVLVSGMMIRDTRLLEALMYPVILLESVLM